MNKEHLLSKANKCDRSIATMKIINRIPTASDQIERETAKLFTPAPLEKFVPFLLLGFWIAILFAIFSS